VADSHRRQRYEDNMQESFELTVVKKSVKVTDPTFGYNPAREFVNKLRAQLRENSKVEST